jgi:hypothetical protein
MTKSKFQRDDYVELIDDMGDHFIKGDRARVIDASEAPFMRVLFDNGSIVLVKQNEFKLVEQKIYTK